MMRIGSARASQQTKQNLLNYNHVFHQASLIWQKNFIRGPGTSKDVFPNSVFIFESAHNKTKIIYLTEIFHSNLSKRNVCMYFKFKTNSEEQWLFQGQFNVTWSANVLISHLKLFFANFSILESPIQFMNAQNKTFTWLNKCSESSPDYYLPVVLMAVINCILTLISYKNPSIYNIIRWFAGPMGQTTRRSSVWCSKYY